MKPAEEVAREILGMSSAAMDGVGRIGLRQLAAALRQAREEALHLAVQACGLDLRYPPASDMRSNDVRQYDIGYTDGRRDCVTKIRALIDKPQDSPDPVGHGAGNPALNAGRAGDPLNGRQSPGQRSAPCGCGNGDAGSGDERER